MIDGPVYAAVKQDLDARNALGYRTYDKTLEPFDDKRDWLEEAYFEQLDLIVYMKAELMRRAGRRAGDPT